MQSRLAPFRSSSLTSAVAGAEVGQTGTRSAGGWAVFRVGSCFLWGGMGGKPLFRKGFVTDPLGPRVGCGGVEPGGSRFHTVACHRLGGGIGQPSTGVEASRIHFSEIGWPGRFRLEAGIF